METVSYTLSESRDLARVLGIIVLATDETLEHEFRTLIPDDGHVLHHTRIPSAPDVTPETLATMADHIPSAAALFPPRLEFDAIGYACTSGALVIGEDRVAGLVHGIAPDAAVTNPLSAVKARLSSLGARRVGILTPYVESVTRPLADHMTAAGFEVSALASFGVGEERAVARIDQRSTLAALRDLAKSDCDALFASCTNLATVDILAEAERETGMPVISSNSALAWHLMDLAAERRSG